MTNPAKTYYEAKKAADVAKKAMETAKRELIALMDQANTNALMIDGYTVTRSECERMAFDSKAFSADEPEIFAYYKRPQTVHHFSVTAA